MNIKKAANTSFFIGVCKCLLTQSYRALVANHCTSKLISSRKHMFSSLVHYLLPVLLGIVVPRALSTNRFAVISLLRIRLGEAVGKLTSAMVLSSGNTSSLIFNLI
ncbi:hypothetical protein [Shewanella sp. GutDb-MelDb]|uniref:hypothetical protein n=1 Tax=Shewanella sp. GutDb-MelDb TaxID=2058316 RepID=UPI0011AE69AB|nr:hypothetical protein [Shewanella sp. GutDb-MelDb]